MEVDAPDFDTLSERPSGESSPVIKARVDTARAVQARRFGPAGVPCNAQMGRGDLEEFCPLDDSCQSLLKGAFERMGLTARSYDRILRVARTIADLDGSETIQVPHLAEALQYRSSGWLTR